MFAKRPKPLLSLPKQQLSNPHFFFSTPTTLHTPLSSLPPRPSINQTKQAHAQIIVSGLAANASFTGHLLASLALSPSTPFAYSLSIYQTIQYPSLFASNNMIRCLAKSESPRESVVLYSCILGRNLIPNNHTYTFLLQACSKALAICEGTQKHFASTFLANSSGACALVGDSDKSSRSRKLKHDVTLEVNELIHDIATCLEEITEQEVEHIHQIERVLQGIIRDIFLQKNWSQGVYGPH
nr:putative pentatricopeptide repeat-containing protein [Quercus suber]